MKCDQPQNLAHNKLKWINITHVADRNIVDIVLLKKKKKYMYSWDKALMTVMMVK